MGSVEEHRKFKDVTMAIILCSKVLVLPLSMMLSNHAATKYSFDIDPSRGT
jgi:hypothetical protein